LCLWEPALPTFCFPSLRLLASRSSAAPHISDLPYRFKCITSLRLSKKCVLPRAEIDLVFHKTKRKGARQLEFAEFGTGGI
jgi:hypothetical protein